MGQAKHRLQQEKTERNALARVDIPKLAAAIKKLFLAAGSNVGSDCFDHAALGVAMMGELGVSARMCAGYAAWRTGPGDSDVIAHHPGGKVFEAPKAFLYHAWIEVGGMILDLTTYQLRDKAVDLDRLDGGKTAVQWAPEFLFEPRERGRSYADVAKLDTGMFCYERLPEVEKTVVTKIDIDPDEPMIQVEGGRYQVSRVDLAAAMHLYNNPRANVVGPNDMASIMDDGKTQGDAEVGSPKRRRAP